MMSRLFNRVLRIDRWTRTRFTALGRMLFASLIGVGLFALNPRATLAYQLAVMVLAVVVASVLWAPLFRPRLRLRRSLPRYATVDAPLRYSLELVNEGARSLDDFYLRDEPRRVAPSAAMAQARAELAHGRGMFRPRAGYMRFMRTMRRMEGARCSGAHVELASPGQPVQVPMELVPLRRGDLYLDHVQVTRTDPLGVFRALERVRRRDCVLVLPRRYPVTWDGAGVSVHQPRTGETRTHTSGAGSDFARLREYRPRDPPRHIHWRAWARLGEPMVKEFHEESPSRNALVLDTCAPSACSAATFEEAVSVAASFVAEPRWRRGKLDLLFTGADTVHLTQGSEGEGVGRMLEALAGVARSDAGRFPRLAQAVTRRVGGFGACVLVLLDLDAERAQLVRALHAARVSTLVLVVAGDATERVRAGAAQVPDPSRVFDVKPGQAARVLAELTGVRGVVPSRA